MVSMVSGCLMYTVLVANTTAMIANVDPAAKEYKSKVCIGDTVQDKHSLQADNNDSIMSVQVCQARTLQVHYFIISMTRWVISLIISHKAAGLSTKLLKLRRCGTKGTH